MRTFLFPCMIAATPLSAQTALLQTGDYPAEAIRKGEEGTVRVKLRVSTEGRVTDCAIVQSASPSLDLATCRILRERARFLPATDDDDKPIEADFEQSIRWQLGDLKKKKERRDATGLRF